MAGFTMDPFASLLELQRNLDRFLQNPRGLDIGPSGAGVFPPINVFRDASGFVVRAEVAGIPPEALNISSERATLTITGERVPEGKTAGSYHRRERRFGKFSRSLQLPNELDGDKAVAECSNGILTIRIPKREEAKPRQIKIQSK